MSIFAGVFARGQGQRATAIPSAVRAAIKRVISRSDDSVMTYEDPAFFLAKVDLHVFPTPAWVVPQEGVMPTYTAALSGHPFFEDDAGGSEDRGLQLQHIAAEIAANRYDVLRRCQGMFTPLLLFPGTSEARTGCRQAVHAANVRVCY